MANPMVDMDGWVRVEDPPAFSLDGWAQVESAPQGGGDEVETLATLPVETRQDEGDLADLDASLEREDAEQATAIQGLDEAIAREEEELARPEARDKEVVLGEVRALLSSIGVSTEGLFQSTPHVALFDKIAEREGSGDTVTDVPTAHFGVTKAAADAVGMSFSESMSKEDSKAVSMAYLGHLDSKFSDKVSNWGSLPEDVKDAALDTAYNVGPQIFSWTGFITGLESGTKENAAIQLLDSASADGKKSLKGLAKRRAEQYNEIVGSKVIDKVEQEEDGTLIYWSSETEIFRYKPSGGRHEDSSVGSIAV